MPLTRAAQQDREADTVRSAPGRSGFHAPTIEHTLRHLTVVAGRLHGSNQTAANVAWHRRDLDALLDRYSLQRSVAWPADEAT